MEYNNDIQFTATLMSYSFQKSIQDKLRCCGITNEEVLANTPRRFEKFLESFTENLNNEYTDFKSFPQPNANEMVTIEVNFGSLCEHHLLPYIGKAFVAYLPRERVVGLSKIIKLVQHSFKRPSIQEAITESIANRIYKETECAGVAVTTRAYHTCVGLRYADGWSTVSTMLGKFNHKDPKFSPFTKQEYLSYIQPRLAEMRF